MGSTRFLSRLLPNYLVLSSISTPVLAPPRPIPDPVKRVTSTDVVGQRSCPDSWPPLHKRNQPVKKKTQETSQNPNHILLTSVAPSLWQHYSLLQMEVLKHSDLVLKSCLLQTRRISCLSAYPCTQTFIPLIPHTYPHVTKHSENHQDISLLPK